MKKIVVTFAAVVIAILASIQFFMSLPAYGTTAPDSEQAVPAYNCHNLFYESENFPF